MTSPLSTQPSPSEPSTDPAVPSGAAANGLSASLTWVALALAALVVLLRWRWLDVPFERDEGEYVYGGRLLLEGVPPYVGLYNMKFPGVYGIFALIQSVFGTTPRGIHLALAGANACSLLLLFSLARRLLDARSAVVAASAFAVAQLLPAVQGPTANAEHFLLPFALAGLLLIASRRDGSAARWFGAGLLLGLALLIKQHGLFLAAAGVTWALLAGSAARFRRFALVSAGVLLPIALVAGAYAAAGHFDAFWLWTVRYAAEYAQPTLDLPYAAGRFQRLGMGAPLLFLLAALGLAALWKDPLVRAQRWRLASLALFSFAAVTPGFHFRPHYFVLLLPAAALLAAAGVRLLPKPASAGPWCALALLALPIAQHFDWFLRKSPAEVSRELYPTNPFVESPEVGRYLAERTQPDERIAVLGSEPQIYVYSGRRAATGFIYTYALMESHPYALAMQKQMAREIEESAPAWIVVVRHPLSWLTREESETEIFRWFDGYSSEYRVVARLLLEESGSRLVDGAELDRLPQPLPYGMDLFRRRGAESEQ